MQTNNSLKNIKLIGISPRLVHLEDNDKLFVNKCYLDSLQDYKCNTIMLTPNNYDIKSVLELCDGFLITGGFDINPNYYNEDNLGLSKNTIEYLDTIDKAIIEYAKETKKPVLGICRGHQAINIFLGGTLYQDIGSSHKDVPYGHTVKTVDNSILKFDEEILVNSYHHQAVNKLAPDMIEVCKNVDGINEAIIHKELPIIGIQWHPEKMRGSKESKIIFDKFFEFLNK